MSQLSQFIDTYQDKIDDVIRSYSKIQSSKYLIEPIHYILGSSGKKIRPFLLLLTSKMCKADMNEALKAAAAIELFHIFSLVHDDIMDKDEFRRGKQTIHKKWDESVAILAGDGLLAISNMIMTDVNCENFQDLMKIYSKTFFDVCEGQAFDKEFEKLETVTIDEYLHMIGLKTSALLGASCHIGALIANKSKEDWKRFYDFGYNLGLAFQIQDDILDLFADQNILGKDVASDIFMDKKSILTLLAKQNNIDYSIYTQEKNTKNIDQIKALFEEKKILEKAIILKDQYSDLADNFLSSLEDSEEKSMLSEMVEKLNNRIS